MLWASKACILTLNGRFDFVYFSFANHLMNFCVCDLIVKTNTLKDVTARPAAMVELRALKHPSLAQAFSKKGDFCIAVAFYLSFPPLLTQIIAEQ